MHFYFSLQSSFSQTIFRHLLVGEKRGSSMDGSWHKFMNVRLSESSFTNGLSWWSKKYQHLNIKLFLISWTFNKTVKIMNEWRQRQGRGHESWLRNVSVFIVSLWDSHKTSISLFSHKTSTFHRFRLFPQWSFGPRSSPQKLLSLSAYHNIVSLSNVVSSFK